MGSVQGFDGGEAVRVDSNIFGGVRFQKEHVDGKGYGADF